MSIMYEELKKALGERLKENKSLATFTTLKIGGPADFFYEAKTKEELVTVVRLARKLNLPLFILGGGSNILIGDKGIRGMVIKNNTGGVTIRGMKGSFQRGKHQGTVFVEADSGVIMNKLVRFSIEEGLAGLEMHLGLPGTVGGAIYMNSKWTHPAGSVGDVVYQGTILTPENELKIVPSSYFHFGYDLSSLQKTKDILISIVFSLKSVSKEKLWQTANDSINYRRLSQPQGVFTAGCTFRNITKAQAMSVPTPNHTTSAGFLLDHAGLKGICFGGAQISPVHANFIINFNHATASDIVQLIELARLKVKEQFNILLSEEIVRVGEF